jgi:hypothetical protein
MARRLRSPRVEMRGFLGLISETDDIDHIQDTQRRFLTTALRSRALDEFMIIEVPGSRRPVTGPPSVIA